MDNNFNRRCKICNEPLPPGSHGNLIIHPSCESQAKALINHSRYSRIKNICNLAIRLDTALAKYFPLSNGDQPVSKSLLEREGFNWDFNSSITQIEDESPIFWVLDYGYSFTNKKCESLIIYYACNPIQQP